MTSKYPNIWPKVVLLGDSLTQHSFDEEGGFGSKLASLLKRKADVINRGFSGYTTATLKLILPRIFNKEYLKDVACLTLCIGANDSWFPTTVDFNPALTVEEYKSNLVEIINFLLKNGLTEEKILLITPPTIELEGWSKYCLENAEMQGLSITKTPEHTKKYVDAMVSAGNEMKIKVFDTFELTSRPENMRTAFIDGLHFSVHGANLVYDLIKDDVEQLVRQYRSSDLENFPTYNDINFNELEKFFG